MAPFQDKTKEWKLTMNQQECKILENIKTNTTIQYEII